MAFLEDGTVRDDEFELHGRELRWWAVEKWKERRGEGKRMGVATFETRKTTRILSSLPNWEDCCGRGLSIYLVTGQSTSQVR